MTQKPPKSTDQTFDSSHESEVTLKNTNKINYETKFPINPILKNEIEQNQPWEMPLALGNVCSISQ